MLNKLINKHSDQMAHAHTHAHTCTHTHLHIHVHTCIHPQTTHIITFAHTATHAHNIIGQRQFTENPANAVSYANVVSGPRNTLSFQCTFEKLTYYGAIPEISWEYQLDNGTTLELIAGSYPGAGKYVSFQYDHTGHLQVESPDRTDDGAMVRCITTGPNNSGTVASDWASVRISSG